jgi:hypothetical protein
MSFAIRGVPWRTPVRSVLVAVAVALVAGCGGGRSPSVVRAPTGAAVVPASSSASPRSVSASGSVPTVAASAGKPTVTIQPSAGLKSGQVVHVTGGGFSPNESLVINECADKGAKTGPADCALGALTPTRTDAGGNVRADFTVTVGPFGINKIVCGAAQPCLLSVSEASLSPTEEADVRLDFG